MRKQDQLIHLIHSLTTAEKKFFKEYTAKNKTGQSYMKLYEELQKSHIYDADGLCQRLQKTKANLGHEKEYLQEVLFKALRDFHSDDKEIRLNNTIDNIEILLKRGCYEMAHDLAGKTIKEAEKMCDFIALQRLYNLMMGIAWFMAPASAEKFRQKLIYVDLTEKANKNFSVVIVSEKLLDRSTQLWANSTKKLSAADKDEIISMLAGDFLSANHVVPYFRMQQAAIRGSLHYLLGDKIKAVECIKLHLELMEQYPEITNEQTYIATVKNILFFMRRAGMFKEAEAFLDRLETRYYHKLPLNKAFLDKSIDADIYVERLSLCLLQYRTGEKSREEAENLLKHFVENQNLVKGIISMGQIVPYYAAAGLAFLIGDYDTSQRWYGIVIDQPPTDGLSRINLSSRMALAIIQYQFGHYSVAKSLAVTTARFIKKARPLFLSEKIILKFLSNEGKNAGKLAFKQLQKELEALKAIPEESNIQELFYYPEWINRNLQ